MEEGTARAASRLFDTRRGSKPADPRQVMSASIQALIRVPATREVLRGHQPLPFGQFQHLSEKGPGHRLIQQPLPILGEARVIPDRIIHVPPDEPTVKQIVFNMLHQLPLRADRMERLDQARPQEAFGRNRRSTRTNILLKPPRFCILRNGMTK